MTKTGTPTRLLVAWVDQELRYHEAMLDSIADEESEEYSSHNISQLVLTMIKRILEEYRHDPD